MVPMETELLSPGTRYPRWEEKPGLRWLQDYWGCLAEAVRRISESQPVFTKAFLGNSSIWHSHSPHNDVTVSPRSGRAGGERRGRLPPCAPLCHPESTQVLAALCRRQTDPTYTSPTPLPFETAAALRAISNPATPGAPL
ncbi:hypothetical protein D4764_22G0004510 [Takifugu flavidus]|uniref:Uncharacterized protein n=1 Tax=Takifugu flavidus TaxID=433684 RepID=A0A5C6NBJ8_9TELE|nr:hypothetical protein D4764_22G0004510 [Takifugu flavidus]